MALTKLQKKLMAQDPEAQKKAHSEQVRRILKGAMAACELTQKDLAAKVDMSEAVLSNKLNGKAMFDSFELARAASVLKMSLKDRAALMYFKGV